MFFPLGFKTVYRKARKKLLASAKVIVQRTDEKLLPKTAWACKEIDSSFFCHFIDQVCLVNVDCVFSSNFRECLNAYRKFTSHDNNI